MPHGRRTDGSADAEVRGLYFDAARQAWTWDFRVRGARFRGALEGATRAEAKRHVLTLRREALAAAARPDAVLTFAEAAARWWQERGARRAGAAEVARDLAWLQREIGPSRRLGAIDGALVARLASLRLAEGVKPSSVNRTVLEPLRAILRRAALWGCAAPRLEWRELMLDEPPPRPREASADEEARLRAALRPDFHPILDFALASALRLEELVAMRRAHVQLGRAPKLLLIGKGGKQASIPLTPSMLAILQREMTAHDGDGIWTYVRQRDLVRRGRVLARAGERAPITYEGLKTAFARARKAAGLPSTREDPLLGLRLHDLRHTALHRVARASRNGLLIAHRLARHADVKTTMRYVDVAEDELRAAMEEVQTSRETSRKAEASG